MDSWLIRAVAISILANKTLTLLTRAFNLAMATSQARRGTWQIRAAPDGDGTFELVDIAPAAPPMEAPSAAVAPDEGWGKEKVIPMPDFGAQQGLGSGKS